MKESLVRWILDIMTSRQELSGLPICPYARQAYITDAYDVKQTSYETVHTDIAASDLGKYQVVLLYYPDYNRHTTGALIEKTKNLNKLYNKQDIVVLDNDPRDPLILNGVQTTFADCYLWVLQSLADLNEKATQLQKTNYYSYWSREQLDEVVTWRFKTT